MELFQSVSQLIISLLISSIFILILPKTINILNRNLLQTFVTDGSISILLGSLIVASAIQFYSFLSIARTAMSFRAMDIWASIFYFGGIMLVIMLLVLILNFLYLVIGNLISSQLISLFPNIQKAYLIASLVVFFALINIDTIHNLLQILLVENFVQDIK